MKRFLLNLVMVLASTTIVAAQSEGDVIINEIGNSGNNKLAYHGGEFVELLVVKPEGVKLAGWYLTDLSSPNGTVKNIEGIIRFSDAESSVFRQTIPQGTFIVVWFSNKDSVADLAKEKEDISLTDGNNRIVVFAYNSPLHIDGQIGIMNLGGKDNLALLSKKEKNAAIDAVVWGDGASSWGGCKTTVLTKGMLDNGKIVVFIPKEKTIDAWKDNTDPLNWKSIDTGETPGKVNPNVDDSILRNK